RSSWSKMERIHGQSLLLRTMKSGTTPAVHSMHVYELRPRKDHRGVDLISDALPFGQLWYGEPDAISNAVDYAKFYSRSHDAVIRVYDEAGNVVATHEHKASSKSGEHRARQSAGAQ